MEIANPPESLGLLNTRQALSHTQLKLQNEVDQEVYKLTSEFQASNLPVEMIVSKLSEFKNLLVEEIPQADRLLVTSVINAHIRRLKNAVAE